jgi:uncharacterized protein
VRRFNLRSLSFGSDDEAWVNVPVEVDEFSIGGQAYEVEEGVVDLDLTVGRVGERYTLVGRLETVLLGPCQRCLGPARIPVAADGREVALRGESEGAEDEDSSYIGGWELAADRWVRDLIGSNLPIKLLCREGCLGLCPVCGADLNTAGPDHAHDSEQDFMGDPAG